MANQNFPFPEGDDDNLLGDIKQSIADMQKQMQSTFTDLSKKEIFGESSDKTVKITMTATYTFVGIDFDERALKGGVKEFKYRIHEAWKDVTEKIQQMTQAETMRLLQGMNIPEDIRSLTDSEEDKNK